MILFLVNYKNEADIEYLSKYDFFDIKILNEKKWSIFALKLLKLLIKNKNKYDMVLHFGLCGGRSQEMIWNLYKIDRTFLFYKDIIDNQRFKNWNFKFQTISNSNIVTKFNIDLNPDKLYDFAEIFDLETFWVSQVSTQTLTPIFTLKWVSDTNDIVWTPFYYEKLKDNINKVKINLQNFIENDFLWFYESFKKDKDFRKKFYI